MKLRPSVLVVVFAVCAVCAGCANNGAGEDAGTGPHSCADCVQAAACCQAVFASQGNTTSVCSSSETVCQSLALDEQREYIFDCDSYLLDAPKDAAACQ